MDKLTLIEACEEWRNSLSKLNNLMCRLSDLRDEFKKDEYEHIALQKTIELFYAQYNLIDSHLNRYMVKELEKLNSINK